MEIRELFLRGDAFNVAHRSGICWDGGPILLLKKYRLVTKAIVTGKAQIERAFTSADSGKHHQFQELERLVSEDRASRSKEEKYGIEAGNEIVLENRARWIANIPAEIFDREERAARGIPVITEAPGKDSRTSGGVGIDVQRAFQE